MAITSIYKKYRNKPFVSFRKQPLSPGVRRAVSKRTGAITGTSTPSDVGSKVARSAYVLRTGSGSHPVNQIHTASMLRNSRGVSKEVKKKLGEYIASVQKAYYKPNPFRSRGSYVQRVGGRSARAFTSR